MRDTVWSNIIFSTFHHWQIFFGYDTFSLCDLMQIAYLIIPKGVEHVPGKYFNTSMVMQVDFFFWFVWFHSCSSTIRPPVIGITLGEEIYIYGRIHPCFQYRLNLLFTQITISFYHYLIIAVTFFH